MDCDIFKIKQKQAQKIGLKYLEIKFNEYLSKGLTEEEARDKILCEGYNDKKLHNQNKTQFNF